MARYKQVKFQFQETRQELSKNYTVVIKVVIMVSFSFHNHIWLSSQMSKLGGVWAQATQEANIVAIKRTEHYRM